MNARRAVGEGVAEVVLLDAAELSAARVPAAQAFQPVRQQAGTGWKARPY